MRFPSHSIATVLLFVASRKLTIRCAISRSSHTGRVWVRIKSLAMTKKPRKKHPARREDDETRPFEPRRSEVAASYFVDDHPTPLVSALPLKRPFVSGWGTDD